MRVAYTELRDLLRKVFEGLGYAWGDQEDYADAVAWLELHGWPALANVVTAGRLPPSTGARVLYEDASRAVIDAQENGGLIYGSLALDLALFKARRQTLATVELRGARHGELVIPSLQQCAARGVSCVARLPANGQHYLALIGAAAEYPVIFSVSELSAAAATNLTLVCTTAVAALPVLPPTAVPCLTPDDFRARRNRHIEQGISVDAGVWQALVEHGRRVLVATSEASRRKGAGEAAE